MPRKLPLYVTVQRTRNGKIVFCFRRRQGPRTRLPNPASPEFKEAYIATLENEPYIILQKDKQAQVYSLRWLVTRYKESGYWQGLSYRSRVQAESVLNRIIHASGDIDCRKITPVDIQNTIDKKRTTPGSANGFLRTMNALFKWAVKSNHVKNNPCSSVEKIKYKTIGHPPWTMEDAQAFCNHWPEGSTPRLAFELLLYSGLRRSDICRIGKQYMKDNILSIKTLKTGTVVTVVLIILCVLSI